MTRRHTLADLNESLFAALDRLNADGLDMEAEARRIKAIVSTSQTIINSSRLRLEAIRLAAEYNSSDFVQALLGEEGKTKLLKGGGE
jgi:hypothetical protein